MNEMFYESICIHLIKACKLYIYTILITVHKVDVSVNVRDSLTGRLGGQQCLFPSCIFIKQFINLNVDWSHGMVAQR